MQDLNSTSSSMYMVVDILSGVVFRGVFGRQLRKLFVHQEMSYNSKNIRAAVKIFQCRSRANLSENVCQKFRESNQNWGSYEQKGTTYFKEPFLPVPLLKWRYRSMFVLIMQIINTIIINMEDIRQERPNEGRNLKLNKRLK